MGKWLSARVLTLLILLALGLAACGAEPVDHSSMDHGQAQHDDASHTDHDAAEHDATEHEDAEHAHTEHDAAEVDEDEVDEAGHDHHGGMDHGDSPELFDAQFIDGMIEHHQGALEMAEEVLARSERPELRTLAEEIIEAQAREIEMMEGWRAAWFPDLDETFGMDMGMGAMEIDDDESIPFDQRFLEAMISHHVGAVEMAAVALEVSEREEIRTLARDIIADQEAEIELMRGWLLEWYGIEE